MKYFKRFILFFNFLFFVFNLNIAEAALPANELWRENLVNNVTGFGKNTTGGKGGTLCQVTNLNDSGTGSFRSCAESDGAKWITFSVSGKITLQSALNMKSDKSVDGRGADITISGRGIFIGKWFSLGVEGANNIIIHNIKFDTGVADVFVIGITNTAYNVWIDHVTMDKRTEADVEGIYVGGGGWPHVNPAHSITLSWNRFIGDNPNASKAILISDPSDHEDAGGTITSHHNWYENIYVRTPLMRWVKFHAFNNYYQGGEINVQVGANGYFLSENDIYKEPYPNAYPRVREVGTGNHWENYIPAKSVKVISPWRETGGEDIIEFNPSDIFDPTAYYSYTKATADAALKTVIMNGAGWQNIIPPSTLLGDINNDRIVNSLDWSLMSAKWLTSDTSADLNKDGAVNSLDWSIMSSNWLKTQ